jgi:predicted NodU family carbamoyl transferase
MSNLIDMNRLDASGLTQNPHVRSPVISPSDLIIALNPGHDGTLAAVKNGRLILLSSAEQDSNLRYSAANAYFLLRSLELLNEVPAVVAISGWTNEAAHQSDATPYHGIDDSLVRIQPIKICGHSIHLYQSTHERSHIFCAYGMSPFPQGQPCYILVWEGDIGCFYEIDERLQLRRYGPIVPFPGYKYGFLYDLANPSSMRGTWRHDSAGKVMALAGFSRREQANTEEQQVISRILELVVPPTTDKRMFSDTLYLNCGVTNPRFLDLASVFSYTLFNRFFAFAKKELRKGYPLLIAGGCGLNCDWNSKWRDSGLFREVFVPPVANDSGSAIGTAVEAQLLCSGNAKIEWDVYSGSEFIEDEDRLGFFESQLDLDQIADLLAQNGVVAWVHGRSEIGPRALGNRSLLAAPFKRESRDRLNAIKGRETYRPIAPVCLAEDAADLFGLHAASPYMLYLQYVRVPGLDAVTHVDGSARVQTVTRCENSILYDLLSAFKRRTDFGVLCNTSLNRKGRGFFGRRSDLLAFAVEKTIDAVVINSRCFTRGSPH